MDTLDLSPGRSIGLFTLGDTLWHVLDILRARKSEVPKFEIAWDPEVRSAMTAMLITDIRTRPRAPSSSTRGR